MEGGEAQRCLMSRNNNANLSHHQTIAAVLAEHLHEV